MLNVCAACCYLQYTAVSRLNIISTDVNNQYTCNVKFYLSLISLFVDFPVFMLFYATEFGEQEFSNHSVCWFMNSWLLLLLLILLYI